MKTIVVNDTNIFIDLFNVGLLDEFFSLPWEVHTTDLVMLELLREGQQATVSKYKDTGQLHIPTLEPMEVVKIASMYQQLRNRTNLSLTDCSVWYYAKKNHYVLLTGDRKLRKVAMSDDVEVHGIIHVFDYLVECGAINLEVATEKLELLYNINPRLPKDEIDKRLDLWRTEIGNL